MNSKFPGRTIEGSPEIEEAKNAFEAETFAAVDLAAQNGLNTANSPAQVLPYQQRDPTTCFYASLLAIRKSLPGDSPETETPIAIDARSQGLLGMHGAKTGSDRQEQQRNFVRNFLGLEINFIKERTFGIGKAYVDALENKRHVVLGMPQHWVVVDGLEKTSLGPKWTGMDPAYGHRVVYGSDIIKRRLTAHGLPIVIVEGIATPRFRAAENLSSKFKSRNNKFKPAKPRFQQR